MCMAWRGVAGVAPRHLAQVRDGALQGAHCCTAECHAALFGACTHSWCCDGTAGDARSCNASGAANEHHVQAATRGRACVRVACPGRCLQQSECAALFSGGCGVAHAHTSQVSTQFCVGVARRRGGSVCICCPRQLRGRGGAAALVVLLARLHLCPCGVLCCCVAGGCPVVKRAASVTAVCVCAVQHECRRARLVLTTTPSLSQRTIHSQHTRVRHITTPKSPASSTKWAVAT
jgi:hypothetical protein